MTLSEKQQTLFTALAGIKDAQERFAYLVERGRRQPPLDAAFKTPEFRVDGCLANLWFVPDFKEGKCFFRSDADSLIVKSIAGLLCDFYSGHAPEQIMALEPSFLGRVGITQHLTPNRRNSLSRVWEKIRTFAVHQQSQTRAATRSNLYP